MKTAILCSIVTISLLIAIVTANPTYAEEEGSLEIFVKLANGLRASANAMTIKIYQVSTDEPLQEIEVTSNPFFVNSLSLDHSYKIEVYDHSIFAAFDIVKMEKSKQNLDLTIPGNGGLDILVLYNDKTTPIADASIDVFSYDDKLFKQTWTYLYGETPRIYIPITTLETDYFYVDIKLTENITQRVSPVTIHKGTQELKVITDWPPMIEDLFTVKVFDSSYSKFTNQEGYFVEMVDKDGNVVKKSKLNPRGMAYFSNFKVNDYDLVLKKADVSGIKNVAKKSLSLTGQQNSADIIIDDLKNVEREIISVPFVEGNTSKDTTKSCNCVAFRLSNVQDFYLNDVQVSLINLFDSKDVGLTIGVTGDSIGEDSKITEIINEKILKKNLLVANLGWKLIDFTSLSEQEQYASVSNSKAKIFDVFGIQSTTFIAPYSKSNEDTIKAIRSNGMTYFSSSAGNDPPPYIFQNSIPFHVPYTLSIKDVITSETGETRKNVDGQARLILDNLDDYGYSVINIQSQDFAQFEGEYQNLVDSKKLSDLSLLINSLQNDGIKIVTLDEIPGLVTPKLFPSWVDTIYLMYEKGQISHSDLVTALDYLVFKKIIQIEGYSVILH